MSERGDDYFLLGRGVKRATIKDAFEPISTSKWQRILEAESPPRSSRRAPFPVKFE